MPLALLLAQISGIAQIPEFVTAILVTTSLAPVQIYMNEVFAPTAVRYNQSVGLRHGFEIALAIFALSGWLAYRIEVGALSGLLIMLCAQGYVWFSYRASRRVLEYQASSIIGGRYSYIIGSIIPLTFLLVVLVYWLLSQVDLHGASFLYLLILLPNAAQYLYTRFGWMAKERPAQVANKSRQNGAPRMGLVLFLVAMLMAVGAQHWKIELAGAAVGFAALSIYLISPFSSMWLIHSKSKYMTKDGGAPSDIGFWLAPCLVILTLPLNTESIWWTFLLALVTQVLTFKFITDIRLKTSMRV